MSRRCWWLAATVAILICGPSRAQEGLAPVHEAFREPVTARVAVEAPVAPPGPISSRPAARPGPAAAWIPGYWDYDAGSQRFRWVDGVWRVPPPGLTWESGYWARGKSGAYERIAGFWMRARRSAYETEGPPVGKAPAEEPGAAPGPDRFWVAGHHVPKARGVGVEWKPGFWSKVQPGWVWQPAVWLDRPAGWAYEPGFWVPADLASNPPRGSSRVTLTIAEAQKYLRAQTLAGVVTSDAEAYAARHAAAPRPVPTPMLISPSALAGGVNTDSPIVPNWSAPNANTASGGYATPPPSYYIGNSAPGQTYGSYSREPTGVLGQSTYIGSSAPGQSYPSYASSPAGLPGQTYYIGNSAPGQTYGSYSTSGNSVGGYGYGASPPGTNTGGQVGGTGP